ncbi:MAG TPA: PAS domain S-box protein, partial [Puia sp.]|nr:PAS domain S-box protein [Puia sp.]
MFSPETITFESEAGFQALFKYATVGILVINSKGNIELANPCIESLFGYSNSELIGRPVEILIPTSMQRRHVHYRNGYFENPKARPMGYGMKLFARRKDGSEFPVEISLGHYELSGEPLAVAFVTDTTEIRKIEAQLRETANEYRLIFDGIHESFMLQQIVKNESGKITDLLFLEVNPAAQKILGKSRDQIIGHLRSEFFGPLDDRLTEIIARVEQGENVSYEQYIKSIDRWFDRRFYLHKPGQLIALSIDITQNKRDEEALKRNQSILERETVVLSFLNESSTRLSRINNLHQGLDEVLLDAISLTGAEMGNVQLLDRENQALVIVAQKGFSGEFLEHFREVSATDSSACGQALHEKKQITIEDTETDVTYAGHREIAQKSGYRAVQSTPLFGLDGSPIGMISTHYQSPHVFTSQDLNKMELFARNAESFIERCVAYSELEMKIADRTSELALALEREKELGDLKSRFVSIASHEFRTPLSTILSSTSLVESYNKEGQEVNRKKHTNRIKSSVKTLTDILNDFLSLEKLELGKVEILKETLNLHQLSVDIVEDLNELLKTGQTIHVLYAGNKNVTQDKKVLRHVLSNLLSNAIKYSGEHKKIQLSLENDDNLISIEVKDEGIGIPEEDQKNLFDSFYRAKNATNIQGT